MSIAPASEPRRKRRRRQGMTLLEVVLAVSILAFLMGGLVGVVRMALSSSASVEETEQRTRSFDAFFRLCDRSFASLPAEAVLLRAASPGASSEAAAEVTLRNAPTAFAIDETDFFFGEIALALRRQPDGDLTLGSSYRRIDRQTGQILPQARWIPLLRNLRGVEWSFFDARTGKWQGAWSDTLRHPDLIRVTIAPADGYAKETAVFRVPPLRTAPPAALSPSLASSSSASSASSP